MSELINNFEIFDVISNDIKKVIKRFYVFDDRKGYNVLFVTLNDKVFGFGSNDFGVCGFGHQMVVKGPKIIEELCDKSVIQFYNGISFAFALTSDNKLYGWGRNQGGQLGLKIVNQTKLYKPVLIDDLNDINIKKISCGSAHTLVLTSDGMVYGWGNNEFGQIGCGKELGKKISVIVKLESLPKIESIHCSFCQSFALTYNGMVYSWGENEYCELGHELKQNECVFEPKLIINLQNITSICSTGVNTYFLSNESEIHFCGGYYKGNNEQCFQLLPKVIEFPEDIKLLLTNKLFERSIHSISNFRKRQSIAVLGLNNNVYELNYNRIEITNFKSLQEFYTKCYQLTYGTIDINNELIEETIVETITERFIEINAPITNEVLKKFTICNNSNLNNFSIKYIHIFDDKNGFNVLFVSMDDNVYGFGSNQWGVCGLGHNKNVKDPQIIPELCNKNIQQFYNGLGFVFGLTSDNELYGWGRNDWLQLGSEKLNKENNKPININIKNQIIKQISCGSEHNFVLTNDGLVNGWGCNYRGQIGCGEELGKKISMTRLTSLPIIKSIHCSYCQSFALTDNGMVYSWGYNQMCELGHELKQNECIFEPKLIINLTQITSICSSSGNTYFLTINGTVYFCGQYYDKNQILCYQMIPKLITNELNIHSLHSINCYQQMSPIGCALSDEWVYSLNYDSIDKTNYKNLEEFYSNECQLTYKTYYLKLISGIQKNKIKINGKISRIMKSILIYSLFKIENLSKNILEKMTNKIDSGSYGTVYKVEDEDNRISAIKIFESTSNIFFKNL